GFCHANWSHRSSVKLPVSPSPTVRHATGGGGRAVPKRLGEFDAIGVYFQLARVPCN
ncbi:hypothetical protein QBC45DRAFT_304484, partial [Copromyces sp. CBS 386.78]